MLCKAFGNLRTIFVKISANFSCLFNVFVTRMLIIHYVQVPRGDRGDTVVKVLCYKSEGRWFDPRWWNFALT